MLFIYSLMIGGLFIMDNFIIINLNMFSNNSQVFMVSAEKGMVKQGDYTIEQLPAIITQLAHESNVYNVKISGNNNYSKLITYGVEMAEMIKYNENKIQIEVI